MGKLQPVYIIHSPHPLLVSRAVAEVQQEVGEDPTGGFNTASFEGKQATAAGILAAVSTMPMMADYRIVTVSGLEHMPAKELSELISYLESPNPQAVLIMTATKVDGRLKFYQKAKKLGFMVAASPPRDLAAFAVAEAKDLGMPLPRPVARRLVEVVGDDISRLSSCVEQVALFAGDEPVTVEHVESLIATTREESIFELTDAIGQGNRRKAQALVHDLLEQRQSAIGALALLARFVRQLGIIGEGISAGAGKGELAKAAGVPPFVVGKLTPIARRIDSARIVDGLKTIADADHALKGGAGALKTLGRPLAEAVVLGNVVDALLVLSGESSARQ